MFDPPVGIDVFDERVTLMPKSECVDVGRPLPDAYGTPAPRIVPVEYAVPVGAWLVVVVFLPLAVDTNSSYCVFDLGLMANTIPASHSFF